MSVRCWRCRMHGDRCICEHVPVLDLATRVVVVMHYREWTKTTSTAPLLALAVPSCEIRIRGKAGARVTLGDLERPDRRLLLLFPSDDAVPLTEELLAADPRPVTLVVPDGSWRQASKMPNREPALRDVQRVTLVDDAPTRYRLRREPKAGGLATYEAIARALGVLEGPQVREELEGLFERMVEGTLETRPTKLRPFPPS